MVINEIINIGISSANASTSSGKLSTMASSIAGINIITALVNRALFFSSPLASAITICIAPTTSNPRLSPINSTIEITSPMTESTMLSMFCIIPSPTDLTIISPASIILGRFSIINVAICTTKPVIAVIVPWFLVTTLSIVSIIFSIAVNILSLLDSIPSQSFNTISSPAVIMFDTWNNSTLKKFANPSITP